jgi:asparagine synthase (glutamine-hydrolysing)
MCGIFGCGNFRSSQVEKAREALHTLSHRGPDQWNEYINDKVYIGHRRLSIIDLSENGRQPMTNADKSVWITVNGEIYNFRELRAQLQNKYPFQSKSDSEVILHGYTEWGIQGLLDRIDGMFSIQIYDKKQQKIFLARDRVGIKPLYYSVDDGQLVWASELKSLRMFKGEENLEIDYTAVYDFLTYQYVPAPKSLFKKIYKLEPAHVIQYDLPSGDFTNQCYWKLDPAEQHVNESEAEREIYRLLKKSVSEQMVSDVPVGFFLSGGMDSSTVVALAREANKNINTFTIGFDKDPDNETRYAEIVANHFQTNHTTRQLDGAQTATLFPRIKEWYDEPFADISCFPTYLVSSVSREAATVVLTGDGGDELFGGYKWYTAFRLLKKYNLRALRFLRPLLSTIMYKPGVMGRLSKKLEWLLLNDFELYTRLMGGLLHAEKASLRKAWNIPDTYDDYWYFRKHYRKDLSIVKRLQFLDFHTYLPDDILTKVDRVSMSVSLECRVPFLSRELIEYVFSLPEKIVLKKGKLKGLMKEAFRNLLPQSILERDKKGFSPPIQFWRKELYKQHKTRHYKILQDVFGLKI